MLFSNPPPLCIARRLSYIHQWSIALTSPRNVICLVYNIWLQVVYVGLTTAALASRLRKLMADSRARVDCATLHKRMAKSKLSGWGILPLQWVEDDWVASLRERHWWWIFRRFACNDAPPGISTQGEGSGSWGWMNQRVVAARQGIRNAKSIKDWPRVKFLQTSLRDLSPKLSIPLYILRHIFVPNLSPLQNTAIQRVVRAMVKFCDIPAWENQALHLASRIVRSNPMTVKRAFERASRKFDHLQSQPPCKCSQVSLNDGTIIEI